MHLCKAAPKQYRSCELSHRYLNAAAVALIIVTAWLTLYCAPVCLPVMQTCIRLCGKAHLTRSTHSKQNAYQTEDTRQLDRTALGCVTAMSSVAHSPTCSV